MIATQQTIFSLLHNGVRTSRDAAMSMRGRAMVDRERVLNLIAVQGGCGATCDEIEVALELSHQSCSARVYDLARAVPRAIRDSGRRRPTRSGRKAIVWEAL